MRLFDPQDPLASSADLIADALKVLAEIEGPAQALREWFEELGLLAELTEAGGSWFMEVWTHSWISRIILIKKMMTCAGSAEISTTSRLCSRNWNDEPKGNRESRSSSILMAKYQRPKTYD